MTAIITDLTIPTGIQMSGEAISGSIAFNGTTQFLSTTTTGLDTTNQTPLGGSIYFDNSNNGYVSYSADSSLDLASGAGNWTVECWYYALSYPSVNGGALLQKGWYYGSTYSSYGFIPNGDGKMYFYVGNGGGSPYGTQVSVAFSLNTWNHFAMVRQGSYIGAYLNGALIGFTALTFVMGDAGGDLYLSRSTSNTASTYVNGYVNNVRIVKGQSVYPTVVFTPPTTPLTAVPGTSVLLNVASSGAYLTDSSINNYTITNNGGVTYNASTPFSSGGSLSFNGTSTSLTLNGAAMPTGTMDFTIEFWTFQPNWGYGRYPRLLQPSTGSIQIYMDQSTLGVAISSIAGLCSVNMIPYNNIWVHIAVTKSRNRVYLFLNGILVSISPETTYSLLPTPSVTIFQPEGGGPAGLLTNFRIVQGTAIYNSNFTPSTFPLPSTQTANIYGNPSNAITGTQTSLLLNAPIGAGFLTDSSSFNHTPTNGGTATSSSFTTFYSNSFTVELWWNPSGSGQANGKIFQTDDGDDYTAISLALDGTGNNLLVYMSSTGLSWNLVNGTSFTLTTGTWYHIALVYDGTTIKLYLNGTGTTLTTVTTFISPIGTTVIGGQTNGKNAYGLISNVRLMNGVAVYTSDFTVPDGPLSITQNTNQNGNPSNPTNNVASTNLMLNTVNNSSYLTDSSYFKNTITANASPTSSPSNPYSSSILLIEYLVVGGGGSGASSPNIGSGGGGAGGFITNVGYGVLTSVLYTITIGAGGAGINAGGGNNGANSSISYASAITALGGGTGGYYDGTYVNATSGGSGGGSSWNGTDNTHPGAALQPTSSSGGLGYAGGNGGYYSGGGGGGAGEAGHTYPPGTYSGGGGAGGDGVASSITGSSVYYAGGGGGGSSYGAGDPPNAPGGLGGGGQGGGYGGYGNTGNPGSPNTGGGGGGSAYSSGYGGNGGSGIVIIKYPDSYAAAYSTTGSPTINVTGGYRIYTWTSSGSIIF